MLRHLVTFIMSMVKIVSLCYRKEAPVKDGSVFHRQFMSVTHSMCLWQSVCICNRLSMFLTDSFCLSQKIIVCQRTYVSVTDSRCLLQTVCVRPRQSLFVTDILCFSQIVCVRICQSVCVLIKHPSQPDVTYLLMIFIKICQWKF